MRRGRTIESSSVLMDEDSSSDELSSDEEVCFMVCINKNTMTRGSVYYVATRRVLEGQPKAWSDCKEHSFEDLHQ